MKTSINAQIREFTDRDDTMTNRATARTSGCGVVLRAAANLELITRVCVIARSANGCFADTEAKGSDLGLVILNVLGSLTFKSDGAGE